MEVTFTIPGEPKGKARRVVTKKGQTYMPKETENYVAFVREIYYFNKLPKLEGMIQVKINAYFKIPKSGSKKKKAKMASGEIRPTKKPDIDNILKMVTDALNELAYDDDKQIVSALVEKYYSQDPRVEVELKELKAG